MIVIYLMNTITCIVSHRNAQVRKACSKALADIAMTVDPMKLFSVHKDFVAVAAKLALDAQPEARLVNDEIMFFAV